MAGDRGLAYAAPADFLPTSAHEGFTTFPFFHDLGVGHKGELADGTV
jgi:hypothetical protein